MPATSLIPVVLVALVLLATIAGGFVLVALVRRERGGDVTTDRQDAERIARRDVTDAENGAGNAGQNRRG